MTPIFVHCPKQYVMEVLFTTVTCQKQLGHVSIYDSASKGWAGRSNWLSIYPDYFIIGHKLTFFCFYNCVSSEAAVTYVTSLRCEHSFLMIWMLPCSQSIQTQAFIPHICISMTTLFEHHIWLHSLAYMAVNTTPLLACPMRSRSWCPSCSYLYSYSFRTHYVFILNNMFINAYVYAIFMCLFGCFNSCSVSLLATPTYFKRLVGIGFG